MSLGQEAFTKPPEISDNGVHFLHRMSRLRHHSWLTGSGFHKSLHCPPRDPGDTRGNVNRWEPLGLHETPNGAAMDPQAPGNFRHSEQFYVVASGSQFRAPRKN